MNKEKIIKAFFLLLLFSFLVLFTAIRTGYYKPEIVEKKELTKKQIEKFEKDLKAGKEIDIKDYTSYKTIDYSSNLSKKGARISQIIEIITDKTLKVFLHKMNRMID